MNGKTIVRADLCDAVRREMGLSAHESGTLVEQALAEITGCLVRGEPVMLTGFGLFVVRQKGERLGRNPRTGEPAPISARRIISFKPSSVLKQRINSSGRPATHPDPLIPKQSMVPDGNDPSPELGCRK